MPNSPAKRPSKKESRNPAIKMLPGFVATVRVRCSKANCRCTRGDRHIAYYHVTYCDGVRVRKYVRRGALEQMREACVSGPQRLASSTARWSC
jgi:hypothetical protein